MYIHTHTHNNYKNGLRDTGRSHGSLIDDGDQPAVGSGHQPPLAAPGRVLFGLFGQRPPPSLAVHDHRHLGYQVVLELAEHQIILDLVARRDTVADVVQVVQQIVGQVHVGDPFLGDARQLGLVVGPPAPAGTADAAAAAAAATTAHAERARTADPSDAHQPLQTLQRRLHDHHFFRFDRERQAAALRTRVGHAQLLGAGLVVLVPGYVPPVQVDEEHGQATQQHARRAEVIARLGPVTHVYVACNVVNHTFREIKALIKRVEKKKKKTTTTS